MPPSPSTKGRAWSACRGLRAGAGGAGGAGRARGRAAGPMRLALARAEVALPRPDASRLVPSLTRAAGDNFLCHSAARVAEVSALALGPLELLAAPGRAHRGRGRRCWRGAPAPRACWASRADYLGYMETPELVARGAASPSASTTAPRCSSAWGRGRELAAEAAGFTRGAVRRTSRRPGKRAAPPQCHRNVEP